MKKLAAVFGILAIMAISGCGGGSDIVGTWGPDTSGMNEFERKIAGAVELTFEKGGKGSMGIGELKVSFEWEIDGDELVRTMSMLGEKESTRTKFKVSGDTLTLFEDGKEAKLKRK